MTTTRARRPQRTAVALALGWAAGALTALPALAIAPWMLLGLMAGISGQEIGTGEQVGTDWGAIATTSVVLVGCVVVPVLVGWGLYRLVAAPVRHRHTPGG